MTFPALWAALQAKVTALVAASWPDLELSCYQDEGALRVLWMDGPTLDALSEVLAPYSSLTTTVSHDALGFQESLTRTDLFELDRTTSERAEALAFGRTVLASGVPPLPPAPVLAAAGVDLSTVERPFPSGVRNALSVDMLFNTHLPSWDGFLHVVSASELLAATDLTDPGVLLAPLDRSEALLVECFATLALDAGAATLEDVGLWAASGGWDLAGVLARDSSHTSAAPS